MELIQFNKFQDLLCSAIDTIPDKLQPIVTALIPINTTMEEKELLCKFYVHLIKTDYELSMLLDEKDAYNTYMFDNSDIAFVQNTNIDINKIKQNVERLCLVPVTRDFSILDLLLIALKQILTGM
jgi:hypothetical protein